MAPLKKAPDLFVFQNTAVTTRLPSPCIAVLGLRLVAWLVEQHCLVDKVEERTNHSQAVCLFGRIYAEYAGCAVYAAYAAYAGCTV